MNLAVSTGAPFSAILGIGGYQPPGRRPRGNLHLYRLIR